MIRKRRLGNVVIAAGDVHKHHAGVVPERADDFLSKPVATEFVATSISSGADGSDIPVGWERVLSDNPHTVLTNNRRGYQVFDIGRDTWRTDVVAVDAVSHRDGRKSVIAKLATERGRPGIERA
jgi:alkaline phosphatase D